MAELFLLGGSAFVHSNVVFGYVVMACIRCVVLFMCFSAAKRVAYFIAIKNLSNKNRQLICKPH